MGNNLNGFGIDLEFGPNGAVTKISYADHDGCGHESEFPATATLSGVVAYHLRHYRDSHDMRPLRRCPVCIPGMDHDSSLQCVHDAHGPETKHRFEVSV
jgi:hypothetical protein